MAVHCLSMAMSVTAFAVGPRRFGYQGPQASVVGLVAEVGGLLVGHGEIGPQPAQP